MYYVGGAVCTAPPTLACAARYDYTAISLAKVLSMESTQFVVSGLSQEELEQALADRLSATVTVTPLDQAQKHSRHDLNNVLQPVWLCLDLLKSYCRRTPNPSAEKILRSCEGLEQGLQQLTVFVQQPK
jgi:hypothetical protein